jgi:hypothetical protein
MYTVTVLNLVLDTNLVVSALFWDGKPLELMALAVEREVRLYATPKRVTVYNLSENAVGTPTRTRRENVYCHCFPASAEPARARQKP